MADRIYDLVLTADTYVKDGKTKGRTCKVGRLVVGDNGRMWVAMPAWVFPPMIVGDHRRAQHTLGFPNKSNDVSISVMVSDGKQAALPKQDTGDDLDDDNIPF